MKATMKRFSALITISLLALPLWAAAEEAPEEAPAAGAPLKATHWNLEVSPEGEMLLRPASAEGEDAGGLISEVSRQRLEEQGWRIAEQADGSLEIYPPLNELADRPLLGDITACSAEPDPLMEMPVADPEMALEIARDWLGLTDKAVNLQIGPVQQVDGVYIANVVEQAPPHRLRHQLAIRMTDGRLVVIY
jgi:hypothetical protein